MIELPEALTLSRQAAQALTGKTVVKTVPASSPHKFTWYNGDVADYPKLLDGRRFEGAEAFGIYAELILSEGCKLYFHDGVNARLLAPSQARPQKHQLLLELDDGGALAFSVSMYGSIFAYRGEITENPYYAKSRAALSPLEKAFDAAYFESLFSALQKDYSLKGFLATEQRIPGLANGSLQDILLASGLHPKKKTSSLTDGQKDELLYCVKNVLKDMTDKGGRDTEKVLFGIAGGYKTMLSKNALSEGCPLCGSAIVKEAYMGGSIYYCPLCQPL